MLKISKDAAMTDVVSVDGSNPITTQHPIEGSSVEVQLYLFNTRDGSESTDKRYEGITLDAIDTSGSDESSWIEFALDASGVAGTYQAGPLNVADITDLDTPTPFWVKVTTPAVTESQNKTDLEIQIAATEFAV